MFEVRFWAKIWCSEVFKVRSCCYVTRLVLEHTVWCSQTVQFFVMFDMFEVRFWAKLWCLEVFEVRYCCYVTRLVLEPTVWCSQTLQFFVMSDMFEVRFWAKMWCMESSMFGHSMFRVFEVRSCCYVTRLVLEHTVWCLQTVQFFVMFDLFEVHFCAKLWFPESSMFGHSMFRVFKVRYFGVCSKTTL